MVPNDLDSFLSRYGIKLQLNKEEDLPWVNRFHFNLVGSQRIRDIENLSGELALSLKVPSVRIIRERETLVIEFSKDVPREVKLSKVLETLPNEFGGAVGILGLDLTGEVLLLNLDSSETPHLLIAGTTGCGKTELLKTFVISLMRFSDSDFIIIDPKGADFGWLNGSDKLRFPVQTDMQKVFVQIRWLVDLMEKGPSKRTIIIIDELADVLMVGGKTVLQDLSRLLQRGRSVGIHVVAATQKPLTQIVGSLTKSNFPVRCVGKVTSRMDSSVASGIPGMGAEKLLGKGDFLLIYNGESIRFQAALCGED